MGDQPITDLNYGHTGSVIYDVEDQELFHSRTVGLGPVLKFFGEANVVVRPNATTTAKAAATLEVPLEYSSRRRTNLTKTVAEIGFSDDMILDLTEEAKHFVDPETSTKALEAEPLALAPPFDSAGRDTFCGAALPAGVRGDDVLLVRSVETRQGWADDLTTYLEVNSLSGETTVWCGASGIIQQLVFSAPTEENTRFLAVRTKDRITILEPRWRPASVRDKIYRAHIDAGPLLYLSPQDEQPSPYMDFAFNPWYPRQFAVVDSAGNWSVWDIEGERKRRNRSYLSKFRVGAFAGPHSNFSSDGWARIMWIGNVNTVLLCTRSTASIFSIKERPKPLDTLNLSASPTTDSVLDVRDVPNYEDHVLVLTSTRLLLLRAQIDSDNGGEEDVSESNIHNDVLETHGAGDTGGAKYGSCMRIVLSWKHFREQWDSTMRMSLSRLECGTLACIYSSTNALAHYFWLSLIPKTGSTTVTATDMASFVLPTDSSPVAMRLEDVVFGDDARGAKAGLCSDYRRQGVQFFKLTILRSSVELEERFLFVHPSYRAESKATAVVDPARVIGPLFWSLTTLKRRATTVRSTEEDSSSDSTVADQRGEIDEVSGSDEEAEYNTDIMHSDRSGAYSVWQKRRQAMRRTFMGSFQIEALTWTVPNERAHDELEFVEEDSTSELSDVLGGRKHCVGDTEYSCGTLLSLSPAGPTIASVYAALKPLQTFLSENAQLHNHHATPGCLQLVWRGILKSYSSSRLPPLYGDMVRQWVSSLDSGFHARFRMNREKLARRCIADLVLASMYTVKPDPTGSMASSEGALPEADSHTATSSQSSYARPQHFRRTHSEPSSQLSSHSQIVPPERSISVSAAAASQADETLSPYQRLSRYTAFSAPTPSPLASNLTRILSHWSIGGDPAAFDYAAAMEAQRQDQQPIPEEVAAQTKAERKRRRQRTMSGATATADVNALPEHPQSDPIIESSLPTPSQSQNQNRDSHSRSQAPAEPRSSQIIVPLMTASQVEPGRYGGRSMTAGQGKKKKRRIEGFQ